MALATAIVIPAAASARPPRGNPDRVRTFLVLRLTEALDLSDEKALQVSRIIRDTEEHRHKLRDQRSEIESKLREALKRSPRDDGELTKLIAEAGELDEQQALAPLNGFREVQKILTLEQQAKLALFRQDLQQEVQRAMRRRLQDRGAGANE
jgi:hypothetical protein